MDLPDIVVEVDPDQLVRVLAGLLSNAVKFTPDGGRVSLCARTEDAGVILEVTDSGIGIAEVDQPALFTRFFRSSPQ